MRRVKGADIGASGVGNRFGDFLIAELDGENVFLVARFYVFDKLGDGLRVCFGVFGASGVGGIVVEAVFASKIVKRETVGKDERLWRELGEFFIERIQLCDIVVGAI